MPEVISSRVGGVAPGRETVMAAARAAILLVGVAFGFGATILNVPPPDPLKLGI